jgi:fatty-acyl-CoA synthase
MEQLHDSYCHRGGDLPLLGATIAKHFAAVVAAHGGREAVVSLPQQRRLTYRELAVAADRVAAGLIATGFGPGDRVGIWSTNNIEWLLLQLATARIGVVLVNINPAYRMRELAYALERSAVQGLVMIPRFRSSDYIAMLLELLPELATISPDDLHSDKLPSLRRVVLYDPTAPLQTARRYPGILSWQALLAAGEAIDEGMLDAVGATLDRDDPINIQYTSGTTGFPKAVVLTHHNILNNAWFSARSMHFGPDDRLAVPVPFYHCFGMVLANLLCLSVGACLVLPCEHFDALAVLQAIETEHCTALHGVPTMFIAALEHPRLAECDLSSLRTGIMAGAPCAPALMRRVMDELHCAQILIGYGETEASPITHLTRTEDPMERRVETVGTNLPHQEVKVVDPQTGATLALGEVGEVCFRGYHIMRGYYADPQATAAAIDDAGWLHSGDLGAMDGDGYLRITGRLKEMIIRGGENIYPAEIEKFLFSHPDIAQVAVFGIPDERYGEELVAWVRLHQGAQLDEAGVREFCRGRIAHFKIPRYIRFVDEFPMTVTGKLQKFRMREAESALREAGQV